MTHGRGAVDGRVLVAGSYSVDLVFREPAEPVAYGKEVWADGFGMAPGGAYTLAMGLRRLGREVVWATDFGTDPFSREVLAAARHEGLDERGFRHHPGPVRRVTVALSRPDDRAMVSYEDPVAVRPLAELIEIHRPALVMLPHLQYGPGVSAALDVADRVGAEVFMDCQDFAGTVDMPEVAKVLGRVAVFAPNAAEALRVTGAGSVADAVEVLAGLVRTVVVKQDAAGALAAEGGVRIAQPSVPVEVVDTTGAGDCFNVGFVHRRLAGGTLAECLAAGVACGAAAVTAAGSAAAPDAAGLERWLARLPGSPGGTLTHHD
ncbi:carbohydrate kinase family protein [Streptomyces sp. N2A]|uniref:carbohydrate kinase family protein n=1 Tax=Streptomyces sp. N2A TaxID=3073936 RepID=UPI0028707AF9|nr:carbohydrate kinase family protein [Streptomyces sp. N2A]